MDFKTQLERIKQMLLAMKVPTVDEQTENGKILYQTAIGLIGQDLTGSTPDRYGCAASVNHVFEKAFGIPIGGGASTFLMNIALSDKKRFIEVERPLPGDIIISPTGSTTKKTLTNGHVGTFGQDFKIMSNSSETGKWSENWDLKRWKQYYQDFGGFPIKIYRVL